MELILSRRTGIPVRDQLIVQLELRILDGTLAPGQKLPSVRALARRLKIHANTVSAAYRALEASGRVRLRRGSGVYVVERGPLVVHEGALSRRDDPARAAGRVPHRILGRRHPQGGGALVAGITARPDPGRGPLPRRGGAPRRRAAGRPRPAAALLHRRRGARRPVAVRGCPGPGAAPRGGGSPREASGHGGEVGPRSASRRDASGDRGTAGGIDRAPGVELADRARVRPDAGPQPARRRTPGGGPRGLGRPRVATAASRGGHRSHGPGGRATRGGGTAETPPRGPDGLRRRSGAAPGVRHRGRARPGSPRTARFPGKGKSS